MEITQNALNECFSLVASLRQGFDEFVMHCSNNSEMCRCWEILQQSINYLQNLIAADREGDWEGHLPAVQNLLPIFRECDIINYLRYASLYLEMIRKLPEEHPDIYKQFTDGCFVVKQYSGLFNAESPDMKLEQSIQRSQKSAGGIIGQTRQVR